MLAWVFLATLIGAPGQQGISVAMVLDATGTVTLHRAGESDRPVAMMTLLMENDELVVGNDSQATLLFLDKKQRARIKPNVMVKVRRDGCHPPTAAGLLPPIDAFTQQNGDRLKKLAITGRGGAITVRHGGGVPVVQPIHGTTTLSLRPDFRWPQVPGAQTYLVELKDAAKRPLWKAESIKPQLSYPSQQTLQPGRTYRWEVAFATPKGELRTVVRAEFGTANKATLETLDDLAQSIKGDDPALLLAAAALYHQHGVYDLALPLYERLAELKPGEPFIHMALKDCYQMAGRLPEAEAAHQRALSLGWQPAEKSET